MKRYIVIIISVVLPMIIMAQPQHNQMNKKQWRSQMKEQKMIYFQKEMQLTETERVAFFAIYDDYHAKMHESKVRERQASKSITEQSSELDYQKVLEIFEMEGMKQDELRTNFHNKMKEILSNKKVYLFYKAEGNFKRLLIKDVERNRCQMQK